MHVTSSSLRSGLVAALVLASAILLSVAPQPVAADIYKFGSTPIQVGNLLSRRVAMYSPKDTPASGSPGDGMAYIAANLKFTSKKKLTGSVQVAVIGSATLESVGISRNNKPYICCTTELFEQEVAGCNKIGTLIIDPKSPPLMSVAVAFDNSKTARLYGYGGKPSDLPRDKTNKNNMGVFDVPARGPYSLLIANCDESLAEVTMTGSGTWMNPYGYLPGEWYGYMPFYFWMMVAFMVFTVGWLALNVYYWNEVHAVQHYISFVIMLSTLEMVVWYIDYLNFNTVGERHVPIVVTAMISSVFRRTFSRMLLIAVSLGFGTVRPSLGTSKTKIIILGAVYFVCEASLELTVRYGQTNEVGRHWRLFLSLPVAGLNAIVYWWTFIALFEVTAQLKQKRQDMKLRLYEWFTRLLVLSLCSALAFAMYQIYFMMSQQMTENWDMLWLLDGGFWEILYACMLLAIAVLWKPSRDSKRYAYMQVVPDDDEDFTLELGPEDGVPSGMIDDGTGGDDGVGQGQAYGMEEPDGNIFTIDGEDEEI